MRRRLGVHAGAHGAATRAAVRHLCTHLVRIDLARPPALVADQKEHASTVALADLCALTTNTVDCMYCCNNIDTAVYTDQSRYLCQRVTDSKGRRKASRLA